MLYFVLLPISDLQVGLDGLDQRLLKKPSRTLLLLTYMYNARMLVPRAVKSNY